MCYVNIEIESDRWGGGIYQQIPPVVRRYIWLLPESSAPYFSFQGQSSSVWSEQSADVPASCLHNLPWSPLNTQWSGNTLSPAERILQCNALGCVMWVVYDLLLEYSSILCMLHYLCSLLHDWPSCSLVYQQTPPLLWSVPPWSFSVLSTPLLAVYQCSVRRLIHSAEQTVQKHSSWRPQTQSSMKLLCHAVWMKSDFFS